MRQVRTPGQFWAQYYTPDTQANLTHLINTISTLKPRPLNETIPFSAMTGNYCLALYSLDGLYYRGYVLKMVPEHFAQVCPFPSPPPLPLSSPSPSTSPSPSPSPPLPLPLLFPLVTCSISHDSHMISCRFCLLITVMRSVFP